MRAIVVGLLALMGVVSTGAEKMLTVTSEKILTNETVETEGVVIEENEKGGKSVFKATNSQIMTKNEVFTTTPGVEAEISLASSRIKSGVGRLLQVGRKGKVIFNLANQKVTGEIVAGKGADMTITMSEGSVLYSAVNKAGQAEKVKVTLSSDSVWVLEDDSQIDTLMNDAEANSNICLNGYKLYIGENEVKGNEGDCSALIAKAEGAEVEKMDNDEGRSNVMIMVAIGVVGVGLIVALAVVIVKKVKKDKNKTVMSSVSNSSMVDSVSGDDVTGSGAGIQKL